MKHYILRFTDGKGKKTTVISSFSKGIRGKFLISRKVAALIQNSKFIIQN